MPTMYEIVIFYLVIALEFPNSRKSPSPIAFWIRWISQLSTGAHPHLNFLQKNLDARILSMVLKTGRPPLEWVTLKFY